MSRHVVLLIWLGVVLLGVCWQVSSFLVQSPVDASVLPSVDTLQIRYFQSDSLLESDVDLELSGSSGEVSSLTVVDQSDPSNSGASSTESKQSETDLGSLDLSVKGLPAPAEGSSAQRLELGQTLSLDSLGPMVIQPDGTVRRITNWDKMTEKEQQSTLRIITARNRKRLAALKEQQQHSLPVSSDSQAK